MTKKTALFSAHKDDSAQFVSYAGLALPLHYGSKSGEHHSVRKAAGMFDASHVTTIDVHGAVAYGWLRGLLSNDVAKLDNGSALYSCLCHEDGGVLDDLIVYRLAADRFRLTGNGINREKVIGWMQSHLTAGVELNEVVGFSRIAVQGPEAVELAYKALRETGSDMDIESLAHFSAMESGSWFVSRTGFTGEDGVEILLPDSQAIGLWQSLAAQGVKPAGLAARNTLRLEAGLSRYGRDLDEQHSPAESGVSSTIDIKDPDRDFIGRETLEDHKMFGGRTVQIGLVLDVRGALRHTQRVERVGRDIGAVTSGGFSPTRGMSIALARVDSVFTGGCDVKITDRLAGARIASVPFVPHSWARE